MKTYEIDRIVILRVKKTIAAKGPKSAQRLADKQTWCGIDTTGSNPNAWGVHMSPDNKCDFYMHPILTEVLSQEFKK